VEKPPGHAFISYVREDAHHVDQLQQALEAAGISVWRDTEALWPGEDWRQKIRHAITDNALVFIACFSSHSAARAKSYQNEELLLAIDQLQQRRPDDPWLIPVRFDDCPMSDYDLGGGRTLASIQRADLFGDRYEEQMKRLGTSIQRLLGQRPAAQDARPPGPGTGAGKASAAPQSAPQARPGPRAARRTSGQRVSAAFVMPPAKNETRAFTPRWRAARGHEGAAAIRSTERIFDHIAYRSGADQPPAFLISAIVPCRPLGDSQPGPDGMRQQFGLLVTRPAFMDLIAEADAIGPGCGWRPMAGRGRILLESHLCASTRDPDQFPVASVKLILPDQDRPTYGSDPGQADLLVRINLPSRKAGLPQWRERFARALALPRQLAAFLTGELKVPTLARPAEACLRIVARQDSPAGLPEVVDVSMFETLSAPNVPNEFHECQITDPNGNEISTAARKLALDLAEALHATGYEQALDSSSR
jgi:hypothetical protein